MKVIRFLTLVTTYVIVFSLVNKAGPVLLASGVPVEFALLLTVLPAFAVIVSMTKLLGF